MLSPRGRLTSFQTFETVWWFDRINFHLFSVSYSPVFLWLKQSVALLSVGDIIKSIGILQVPDAS